MPTVSQLVNSPLVDISPFSKKATAYLVTVNFMTVALSTTISMTTSPPPYNKNCGGGKCPSGRCHQKSGGRCHKIRGGNCTNTNQLFSKCHHDNWRVKMGGSDDNDRIKWWQVQDSGRRPKATSFAGWRATNDLLVV